MARYEWTDINDHNPPSYKDKTIHMIYRVIVIALLPITIVTWPLWGYRYYKSVIH